MSEAGGPSLVLRRTIQGRQDGLGQQRSHFLSISADVTMDPLTGKSQSVPSVALPYQLLITVSATGELTISELSTSPGQLGNLLHHAIEASVSSKSPSAPEMEQGHWSPAEEMRQSEKEQAQVLSSRTPRWDTDEYMRFCDHMGELMLGDKQLTMWGAAYLTHIWMNLDAQK